MSETDWRRAYEQRGLEIAELREKLAAAKKLQDMTMHNQVQWMQKHTKAEQERDQLRQALEWLKDQMYNEDFDADLVIARIDEALAQSSMPAQALDDELDEDGVPYKATSAQEQPRCPICDWPLAQTIEHGCVPGNCSYRPKEGTPEYYRIQKRRQELAAAEPLKAGDWVFCDSWAGDPPLRIKRIEGETAFFALGGHWRLSRLRKVAPPQSS